MIINNRFKRRREELRHKLKTESPTGLNVTRHEDKQVSVLHTHTHVSDSETERFVKVKVDSRGDNGSGLDSSPDRETDVFIGSVQTFTD